MFENYGWMNFISRRISRVDRKGRTAVTSSLASAGMGLGIMALVVVMSVMNGFQMSFIDSILEISSFHVRVENLERKDQRTFLEYLSSMKHFRSASPFYEAQGLMAGSSGKQSAVIVRGTDPSIRNEDEGFRKELKIVAGSFDLSEENSAVIGRTLARTLGVKVGDTISALAMSGSSETSLLSSGRDFVVKGIFHCGYAEINATYCFVPIEGSMGIFDGMGEPCWGIKLDSSSLDGVFVPRIEEKFPGVTVRPWRDFNRSFFGALRIEKNMLFILLFLIFVVVMINIFNAMKRLVFERRQEIAVLTALGGSKNKVRFVFVLQGFMTALKGTVPGAVAGIILAKNMETVFMVLSKIQYGLSAFVLFFVDRARLDSLSENPMFYVYSSIPARIFPVEVIVIVLFGILSSLAASWFATTGVLELSVSEVLRDE